MILVADSGSSKTDWLMADGREAPLPFESVGLNPTFCSREYIEEVLKTTFTGGEKEKVSKVFFYGAGCSSEGEVSRVQEALDHFFTNAVNYVSHDIEGSAIATCGGHEGIACILGTGSNACHWSGKEILPQVPSFGMGYIIGDDGSGSHLGKELLRKYLYNEMPAELSELLKAQGLNKTNIVENLYGKEGANRYLAGFARFIGEHIAHPFMQELVCDCFRVFFNTHVKKYENYTRLPVNFVGSVAFVFQEQLRKVAAENHVHIETIIKNPINNLMRFHLGHSFRD